MIGAAVERLQRVAARVVPDPFVLALGLTGLVAALSALRIAGGAVEGGDAGLVWTLWRGWFGGFSGTGGLAFALQMALVLVSGHALAESPPVRRGIDALAARVRGPSSAAVLVTLVSCGAALLNWGLGAVAGALVARRVRVHAAVRGVPIAYPVLGAAAYAGMAVWHGGMSGSAPLKVAESGHFLEATLGVVPLGQTLGGALNLCVTPALIAVFVLLTVLMSRSAGAQVPAPDGGEAAVPAAGDASAGVSSSWLGWLAGGGLGALVVAAAVTGRTAVDINLVNAAFVALGLVAHGSVQRYVDAVAEGARGAGAIVLQFPFYFGIIGLMQAGGLIEWASDALVSVASPASFPAVAFVLAGVTNFFVPSGGGQWAVQGPILAEAGMSLGVDASTIVMAFAYGDAWTNLIQPFWALPLLAVMGLRARDIIGYTAVLCVSMFVVVLVGLAVAGQLAG